MTRTTISIDKVLSEKLREFAESKHGFVHGAVREEAERAIKKHISGRPNDS